MGRRDTLLLSMFTLITSLAWIVFDVYHASIDTTIAPDVEEQLIPITPKFDRVLLDKIRKRENVDPLESGDITDTLVIQSVDTQATGEAETIGTASGGP